MMKLSMKDLFRGIRLVTFMVTVVHSLEVPKTTPRRSVSLVTGANGYLGRQVVHELLLQEKKDEESSSLVLCLVRPLRVEAEKAYWEQQKEVCVMPYDMLDGGTTLTAALDSLEDDDDDDDDDTSLTVFHIASVFGPTEDHKQTALDNVQGTADLIDTLAAAACQRKQLRPRLVLTSSMAAVRGTGQEPGNGSYYTHDDWNSISQLGLNWGASYQWSKTDAERVAWRKCRELGIPMVALCPSFVFGPPPTTMMGSSMSASYSLALVKQWVRGESPVQSRLFCDVRDVAAAHVQAGRREGAIGQRYLVTTEARCPSREIADWLSQVCRDTGLADPAKIHYDADFNGGAIPIGQKEVEATDRLLQDLGVSLRPVQETIMDMAKVLLQEEKDSVQSQ